MYTVEKMMQEHRLIIRLCESMKRACIGILDGAPVVVNDFRKAIDFIRGYADHYHHGKEEKFLFEQMARHLGSVAENMIQHGMLAEHTLARHQVMMLADALDRYEREPNTPDKLAILVHMMGYVNLLTGHIDREDNAVYRLAERSLKPSIKAEIDAQAKAFDDDPANAEEATRLIGVLETLEMLYPG
jgi:hemerythrin-like domain-containing protein